MHEEQNCLNDAHEEYELRGRRGGVAVPISALGWKISGDRTCGEARLFRQVVAKRRCRNPQRARPRNGIRPTRQTCLPAGSQLQFVAACFQCFLPFRLCSSKPGTAESRFRLDWPNVESSTFSRSLAGWLCQANP